MPRVEHSSHSIAVECSCTDRSGLDLLRLPLNDYHDQLTNRRGRLALKSISYSYVNLNMIVLLESLAQANLLLTHTPVQRNLAWSFPSRLPEWEIVKPWMTPCCTFQAKEVHHSTPPRLKTSRHRAVGGTDILLQPACARESHAEKWLPTSCWRSMRRFWVSIAFEKWAHAMPDGVTKNIKPCSPWKRSALLIRLAGAGWLDFSPPYTHTQSRAHLTTAEVFVCLWWNSTRLLLAGGYGCCTGLWMILTWLWCKESFAEIT